MEARRPIQSLWETAPDTVPAKADDLGAIMVSAKAFQVQMAQCKAYEKTVTAQRLNRAGASKIQYAVGAREKSQAFATLGGSRSTDKIPIHQWYNLEDKMWQYIL